MHRLLRDHPAGVCERRQQAQRRASAGSEAAVRGRQPDQHRARERDRRAGEQRARKSLAEQDPGEQRDQDRADVDEHGRRAGVDPPLGLVEGDAVDPEPQQAEDHDRGDVAAGRQRLTAHRHDGGESETADQ